MELLNSDRNYALPHYWPGQGRVVSQQRQQPGYLDKPRMTVDANTVSVDDRRNISGLGGGSLRLIRRPAGRQFYASYRF
jgi:hypothetical protein